MSYFIKKKYFLLRGMAILVKITPLVETVVVDVPAEKVKLYDHTLLHAKKLISPNLLI